MAKYLLGVDMGTTTCKSAIFNIDGTMLSVTGGEYPIISEHPGWAEHDQTMWWSEITRTIKENLYKTKISPSDIVGIGCCAQSHGPNLISKDGRVLMRCIIWPDRRAVKQEQWIKDNVKVFDGRRWEHGGQTLTAVKLLWIKENKPDIWKETYKIILPKSFLVWKLTGKFSEEPQDGGTTDMLDYVKNDWSDDLLNAYGIPREKLAEIRMPWDIVGGVTEKASAETGLAIGTPVVTGSADGPCQTYGAGFIKVGRGLDRTGTVGGLSVAVEKPAGTPGFSIPQNIMSIGTGGSQTAGASFRWARDQLCDLERMIGEKTGIDAYQLMDYESEKVEPGSDGVFFAPYLLGRSGPMNRHGIIFGITLQTKREHIIRAVMEGFGYEIRRGKEKIWDPNGIKCDEVWTTGGGGKSRTWRQIKADILGLTYCKTNVEETGCLGAACIAGYGVGIFSDLVSPIEKAVRVVERNEPRPEYKKRYDELFGAYSKLNEMLEKSGIYDDYVKAMEEGGVYK